MGELTEKELLLLSNYMYMDVSVTKGSVGDVLASMQDDSGNFDPSLIPAASGDMNPDDVMTVLNEMNAASDDFKALTVTEVVNTEGIRGACFVDAAGAGTVVFRGTGGGYLSWVDNTVAGFLKDTALQREAADFVRSQCGQYTNLTVAGHSKGGNMAQYTAVVCGDQVDRCISYDGQGQSTNFIFSNTKKIRGAQGKITSICAHNDFVNILLTSIAGREIFVENKGWGVDAHSAVRLLTDNTFDPETGAFTSLREQDEEMKILKGYLANGVIMLEELPYGVSEGVYNALAGILAGVLSHDQSSEFKLYCMAKNAERLKDAITGVCSEGFDIDLRKVIQAKEELTQGERNLLAAKEALASVSGQGDRDFYTKMLVGKIIDKITEKIEAEYQMLQQLNTATENIVLSYAKGESMITSFIAES